MDILPVIFRKESDGAILAVFPTQAESYSGWHMLCYDAYIGQHGTCSIEYYYQQTRPASPEEYADLLAELTAIYTTRPSARPDIYGEPVTLKPVKRISPAMRAQFLAMATNMRNS